MMWAAVRSDQEQMSDVSGREGADVVVDLGTEFDVSTGTDAAIERCWHP